MIDVGSIHLIKKVHLMRIVQGHFNSLVRQLQYYLGLVFQLTLYKDILVFDMTLRTSLA